MQNLTLVIYIIKVIILYKQVNELDRKFIVILVNLVKVTNNIQINQIFFLKKQ